MIPIYRIAAILWYYQLLSFSLIVKYTQEMEEKLQNELLI